MANNSDALTMRFTADVQQVEQQLRRLTAINNRAAAQMSQAHERAAKQSDAAWGSAGRQLKNYAGLLAGMFGAREILAAADGYTRFTNSLRVAGVAAYELKGVQQQLYDIGAKNGVGLESLGVLYGRATQTAKELGASQQDLMKFTNGVAVALRVQGGDAASAEGALLQLSQMLASGTVHAEEWNSVNEGARPILVAAAAGSEKYKGSVSAMRAAMLKGKVTSAEFFADFNAGSAMLEAQAAKSVFTVSQAFTVLSNSFMKYIGEANTSGGVSALLVAAMKNLANNLPTIANALIVIAGIYGATFIPAIARATTAIVAQGVAAVQTAVVMNAATQSMAVGATAANGMKIAGSALASVMGGALGIALIGVTAAAAYFTIKSAEAAQHSAELSQSVNELADKLGIETESAQEAALATGAISIASVTAGAQMRGLQIDVSRLTDKYYLLAAAARQAAYDIAKSAVVDAQAKYDKKLSDENAANSDAVPWAGRDPMDRRGRVPVGYTNSAERQRQNKAKVDAAPEGIALRKAQAVVTGLVKEDSVDKFATKPATPTPAAPKPDKKTGKKGGGSGPTDQSEQALFQAEQALLNAQLANAKTAAQRADINKKILANEYENEKSSLEKQIKDGSISRVAGDQLKIKLEETNKLKKARQDADAAEDAAKEAADIEQARMETKRDTLREEAANLDDTIERSHNLVQIHDLEYSALEKRQEADRLEFDLSQKQYEVDLKKLNLSEDEVKAMVAKREAIFTGGQQRDLGKLTAKQRSDDPNIKNQVEDYASSFGTLNKQLGNIATGAIADITAGFTDAIMGAKSFGEAFEEMGKKIVAQLIEMAVRFVIFEALGRAFGVSGMGKAALGISGVKAGNTHVGNVGGTDFFPGGLSMVGENGPELVSMPRGSQVLSNSLLRNAVKNNAASQNAGRTGDVNIYTTVNANDAVMKDWVTKEVAAGNVKAVKAARDYTLDTINRRGRNSLVR